MNSFISLFARGGLTVLADRLLQKCRMVLNAAAFGSLLVIGALDQVQATLLSKQKSEQSQFYECQYLIPQLEGRLTRGRMIFELPHSEFQVGPGQSRILPYDNARPYLHFEWLSVVLGEWREDIAIGIDSPSSYLQPSF